MKHHNDWQVLTKYCSKEDTRIDGPWIFGEPIPLAGGSHRTGSVYNKVVLALKEKGMDHWDEVLDDHQGWIPSVINGKRKIEEAIMAYDACKRNRERGKAEIVLRPWQGAVIKYLDREPSDRCFHWFWETQGNTGKSFLAEYLISHMGFMNLVKGKQADMAEMIYAQFCPKTAKAARFIIDLSRDCLTEDRGSFGAIPAMVENILNGRVTRMKYTAEPMMFDRPSTIVIFANCPPPGYDVETGTAVVRGDGTVEGPWSPDRYERTWNMRSCKFINKFAKC